MEVIIKSIVFKFFAWSFYWRKKLACDCRWISSYVTQTFASAFNKSCDVQCVRFRYHLTCLLPFFELSCHLCSPLNSWLLRKDRLGKSKVFFVNFLGFSFFKLVVKAIFEWAANTWFIISLNLVNIFEIRRPSGKIHFAWVHFLNLLKNQAIPFVEINSFFFLVKNFVHLSVLFKNSYFWFSFWVIWHCAHTTTTFVAASRWDCASFSPKTCLQRITLENFF